jgi:hypothetical protein
VGMIWCGIVNGHVFWCVFYLFVIIRNKRVV